MSDETEVVEEVGEEAVDEAAEQKRIDGEFGAAMRERSRVQREAADLLDRATRRIEEATKPKPPPAEEDKPPARDKYGSYEQFLDATLEYQKREFKGYVDRQVEAAASLHRQSAEQSSAQSRMKESADRGEELYPGFEDIIEKVPAMPQVALQAWQELPEPEHVAHYLGTHPEEARKISKMTPGRAAHAVIALGERLDQERAIKSDDKKETPPEFGPKPGGKAAPSAPSANMTMEQYEKARIQEKLRGMGMKG